MTQGSDLPKKSVRLTSKDKQQKIEYNLANCTTIQEQFTS